MDSFRTFLTPAFSLKASKPAEIVIDPLVLRTNPLSAMTLANLPDVSMLNKTNNSVLIYNSTTNIFILDQLSLDGGTF